jgi:hypothetical protein
MCLAMTQTIVAVLLPLLGLILWYFLDKRRTAKLRGQRLERSVGRPQADLSWRSLPCLGHYRPHRMLAGDSIRETNILYAFHIEVLR